MSELIQQQQYDYSNETIDESLLGISTVHNGLIVLKGCRAILRKDYTNMIGKVKIISGGKAGKELAYTRFVGPGMLTAAILGNTFSAPPVDNILKVIEEVDSDDLSGVLLIVQNYAEYPINFTLAKLRAETKGYNVRLIIVNKNDVLQNFDNTIEEQGFLSVLFLHKIAGAMSEEGRNINQIYSLCHYIANSGEIALLKAEYTNIVYHENKADTFSNLSKQMFNPLVDASNKISQDQSAKSLCKTKAFHAGHEVAIMINNFGFNQVETSTFILQVVKQIEILGLKIKRIYVKPFMESSNTNDFHICVLNLSFNSILIKYLDFPTSAPAWPRVLTSDMIGMKEDDKVKLITGRKFCKNDDTLDITLQGSMMSHEIGQIFLSVISMACEAIIACTRQLNKIDEEFGNGDYGTMLARGAKAIEAAIQENKILGTNPFVTFMQISYIIERTVGGVQGGLYSLFFHSIAEAFANYQRDEKVTANMWLNALITANKAIDQLKVPFIGDQTLITVLVAVQIELTNALNNNIDPIDAFGIAVKTAEHFPMNPKFKHPDPQAHAVGIWMRAAYEGAKLKLRHR